MGWVARLPQVCGILFRLRCYLFSIAMLKLIVGVTGFILLFSLCPVKYLVFIVYSRALPNIVSDISMVRVNIAEGDAAVVKSQQCSLHQINMPRNDILIWSVRYLLTTTQLLCCVHHFCIIAVWMVIVIDYIVLYYYNANILYKNINTKYFLRFYIEIENKSYICIRYIT